ncbi:MAG: SDR family oxidoreductase [Chloroflexota bacterium]|nr:SDR family oxidoreductase [Chloroflexota bacterium]
MQIVITGGAGFIGSHLCDTLLGQGHEVTVVDNFLTGNKANIAHLEGHANFRVIEHDITLPVGEDWLRGLGKVDAIFHLASPASPADFTTMPLAIAIINSQGTHNVLEWAKYHKARFLITSTSEAYGDPDVHPQSEEYRGNVSTTGPRACYDEGKRFAEALTSIYANEYEVDARIVRIFNTYGPRMNPHDGRSVPNFITQSIRGEPLTLYGDGSQTRSYCYVSDMVAGLIAVMFAPPETRGMVFNVGNPDEREIRNLAEVIRDACESTSEIVYRPALQDDPVRRCPDITRVSTTLGWQPTVTLQEGLSKTIPWFRERLAQEAREARVAS